MSCDQNIIAEEATWEFVLEKFIEDKKFANFIRTEFFTNREIWMAKETGCESEALQRVFNFLWNIDAEVMYHNPVQFAYNFIKRMKTTI